jgi:hypothetical protein
MALSVRNIIVWLLDLVMAVLAFFLGLRIVFRLFDANPQTPFVNWIYRTSDNLVFPFSGIFPNLNLGTGAFDVVAVIALLAYLVLLYLVIAVVDTAFRAVSDRYLHHHNY